MSEEELKDLCQSILPAIKETGTFIMGELGKLSSEQIDEKGLNSLVSYVDQEAEKRLVNMLSAKLPAAGFLTEEETKNSGTAALRWIIDPLDGTTNFLHQLPFFAISIALQQAGEIVLGVVYECNRKECFYAWKNGGAFLNGNVIQVSKTAELKDALMATGFPYYRFEDLDDYLMILSYFIKNTRGIRRFGSAALDLAFVACGRFDCYFEAYLNPWDVAAGVLLIKEAGGKITDYSNQDTAHEGHQILGSNGWIHPILLEKVKKL